MVWFCVYQVFTITFSYLTNLLLTPIFFKARTMVVLGQDKVSSLPHTTVPFACLLVECICIQLFMGLEFIEVLTLV